MIDRNEFTEAMETLIAKADELIERWGGAASANGEQSKEASNAIRLTEADIMRIPATVRKRFTIRRYAVNVRKRTTGRYKCSYEIRYNRGGVHISASGVTLDKAKDRFIKKLCKEAN